MRALDFAPAAGPVTSGFADVESVLTGLEQAKTAVRALGKYAPIDLVRQLYHANREPTLGGELREVTLMFTDIKDFTQFAETLPPDRLARLLGHYFAVMSAAVSEHGGTIDKYIGDALMVLWNAPAACADHPTCAGRAALACIAATERLFASPEWEGLPPLTTRFGIHLDEVMVGHYGAPSRFSYTALGDGVNLASRLEALNKEYGTTIIVSERIVERARDGGFVFRLLDRVAVKGKSRAVAVYELLGDNVHTAVGHARRYEEALAAYGARDFAGAMKLVDQQLEDPPSQLLWRRCQELQASPPPPEWTGIHAWTTK
jgi:adenylate cyclase